MESKNSSISSEVIGLTVCEGCVVCCCCGIGGGLHSLSTGENMGVDGMSQSMSSNSGDSMGNKVCCCKGMFLCFSLGGMKKHRVMVVFTFMIVVNK